MAFNPLQERGIPMDKQLRNWSELSIGSYTFAGRCRAGAVIRSRSFTR